MRGAGAAWRGSWLAAALLPCACATAPDPEAGLYPCARAADCIEGYRCSDAGFCVPASQGGADAGVGRPPDPARSELTVAPPMGTADGTHGVEVTVRLLDADWQPVGAERVLLAATGDGNVLVQPEGLSGADGRSTGSLASTVAGVKIVSALVKRSEGEIALAARVHVEFVPGRPDPDRCGLTVEPEVLVADGVAVATVTVVVTDSHGNPVAGMPVTLFATGEANALAQPPPTDASGTSRGTLASTKAGVRAVSARVGGPDAPLLPRTARVTFLAGPPALLRLGWEGTDGTSDTAVADGTDTVDARLFVRDARDNPTPDVAVSCTATGAANLLQVPARTDGNGEALVRLASTLAETKTLSCCAGGCTGPLAQSVTVRFEPGPAWALSFAGAPSSGTAGVALDPFVVHSIDTRGRTVPWTGVVTLSLVGGPAGAVLQGTISRELTGGWANFTDLRLDQAGGDHRLRASTPGLNEAVSEAFAIAPGPASRIEFQVQPGNGRVRMALQTSPRLTVVDSFANRVDSATDTIRLTLQGGAPGAWMSGLATRRATAGTAAFTGLSVDTAGVGYALKASAAGLPGATSEPFDVTEAPWKHLGPWGAARVLALGRDASDPDLLYAGTRGAGLYRSTDNGGRWTLLGTIAQGSSTTAWLTLPWAPATVLAASTGDGIHRSRDGGATWTPASVGLARPSAIALDRGGTSLWALARDAAYRSTDEGDRWMPASAGLPTSGLIDLRADPADPMTAWVLARPGGVFRTIDGGASWTPANTGLAPADAADVVGLALDPGDASTAVLVTYGAKVFRTTDGGASWMRTASPARASALNHAYVVGNSPTWLWVSGHGLDASTDGGATWVSRTPVDDCNVHEVLADPTRPSELIAATDAGVFKSANAGLSWQRAETGLASDNVMAVLTHPSDPAWLLAALSLGLRRTPDGGASWTSAGGGVLEYVTPYALAMHPQVPTLLFATSWSCVWRSTDGGGTWSLAKEVPSTRVTSAVVVPGPPTRVFAGLYGQGILRSDDGGATWVEANAGLASLFVKALAGDPADASKLYAVTDGGNVHRSSDGSTWTRLPLVVNGTSIAVSAPPPRRLYVGAWTGVHTSADEGATWGWSLQGHVVNSVAVDPSDSAIAWAATADAGLQGTTDGGATWAPVDGGLAGRSVSLVLADPTRPGVVYAGAEGAGLYRTATGGR